MYHTTLKVKESKAVTITEVFGLQPDKPGKLTEEDKNPWGLTPEQKDEEKSCTDLYSERMAAIV